jgi:hypothetical protein
METESRELATGGDGDSAVGTGMDGAATRWRGRALWET